MFWSDNLILCLMAPESYSLYVQQMLTLHLKLYNFGKTKMVHNN